ncbi:MAG: glycolate oxidase subunit GlcE [Alcaligenaceae bacterium]|nr:glycolate oxidase subunit GlcE [Alcaligenaceae bacterium]
MDHVIAQLREQVLDAARQQHTILIEGGGTKNFYGNHALNSTDKATLNTIDNRVPHNTNAAVALKLSALHGIINYQPTELVVTAWAGTPLQEVIDTLAASAQMLAFDPPAFGAQATLGGCVAAGLAGPGRYSGGPVKDYVLGTHLLTASGSILKFGGEVMKNVAGYDVSRLLVGSLGMFGALTQVSVKVAPRPQEVCTLEFALDEASALALCHGWRAQPLPISATAWQALEGTSGCLRVRLAGAGAALKTARLKMGGQVLLEAQALEFWSVLREQKISFFTTPTLWRLAVAPGTPALNLGPTLIEWGGGQRWVASALDATTVRRVAEQAGGHATLFRSSGDQTMPDQGVFHPLTDGVLAVVKRLKQEFDPQGLFNPGRLVHGL